MTQCIYRDDLPSLALSIRQPWAWCIMEGGKNIENRSAGAINVGRMESGVWIAIHASKGMTRDEYEDLIEHPGLRASGVALPRPDELLRGAIIGRAFVKEIITDSSSPWWCGPRGLVLTDVAPCKPFGCKGQLGFFEWQESGEPDAPSAWMTSWPERTPRIARQKAAMPTNQTDFLTHPQTATPESKT